MYYSIRLMSHFNDWPPQIWPVVECPRREINSVQAQSQRRVEERWWPESSRNAGLEKHVSPQPSHSPFVEFPANMPGKWQVIAQVFGSLPPNWENLTGVLGSLLWPGLGMVGVDIEKEAVCHSSFQVKRWKFVTTK